MTWCHSQQRGVPFTEAQFRDAFAEMRAARNRVPAAAYRDQMQEAQYEAVVKRFSVLAGTYQQDFLEFADAGRAWQWYSENDPDGRAALCSPRVAKEPSPVQDQRRKPSISLSRALRAGIPVGVARQLF